MLKYLKCSLVFFSALFLASCVTPRAEFQSKSYSPQKKGVIKYDLAPNLFQPEAVQMRRMDAERKMESFCGSQKPFILSEQKEEKKMGHYTDTSYHDESSQRTAQYGAYGAREKHSRSSNRYGERLRYGAGDRRRTYRGGRYSSFGDASDTSSGGARTVSRPIIRNYNIISFECR